MYGVADFIGDSYGLSLAATRTKSEKIIFCSVHFMAETAKILNPQKTVINPVQSGCSLAESITAKDVQNLKKLYPNAPVVCYINTSAQVKAESDICCTSSNAEKIINYLPNKEIIFIPDEFMAKNLQARTTKKLITWNGRCIVHEQFTSEQIKDIKKLYPEIKILAHPECSPSVIHEVDLATGTEGMLNYIEKSQAEKFMLITECGITDRVKTEFPQKKIIGTCFLCPYMKQTTLKNILQALKSPTKDQIIDLDPEISQKAKASLDRMIEITRK
ncbi:hypothetical protein A2229_05445 [Candidatus Peregrinibacteria bacterium RIFOXYA2_FULL_33_7]|nr:MAG: hypothetical protein A2229_05445 [Candidatus Peregrinibacteria bacterium RIFOXYA2_FULL_33_7]